MRIAIIGSKNFMVNNIEKYIPDSTTEIIVGSTGIETNAEIYAEKNGMKLTVFSSECEKRGISNPFMRGLLMLEFADEVIAFWDGVSKETRNLIEYCFEHNKKITVYLSKNKF